MPGLVHVADCEKNQLSKDVVEMLETASLQLGAAIQQVSVEDVLQKSY